MTYTFKLARRLAVSRNYAMAMVPALALLAACAIDDSTAPVSESDAQWRDRTTVEFSVSPDTLTVETNQVARFSGRVHSPLADSIGTAIEWTTSGGSITSDGLFSSTEPGMFRIVGRGRKKTDTATVIVVPPQSTLASLTISPANVELATGASQQFSAAAKLSDSTTATVGLVWTATGGAIDASGRYTAGSTAGSYRVVVANTDGTVADTAVVTLAAPAPAPLPALTLTQVVLVPGSTSLLTGGTQQFATYGRMSNGDSVAVAVTYSATGGTVTSGGLYTAGATAGTFKVIAKAGSGPADTAAITLAAPTPTPTLSGLVGIPIGGFHAPATSMAADSGFSGFLRVIYLPTLKATLDSARARKARVLLAMPRAQMRNADNTFNLTMWKQEVDRYRAFDFQPYITDGTLLGIYMIDEPDCGGCWGGKTISQATVDELGRYIKASLPNMTTFARVTPGWFKSYGVPLYVDVAWAQWEGPHYPSANMTPEQFRDKNVADAQAMRMGLVLGMNTLDGGSGSSGIAGTFKDATTSLVNRWQMSAAEVERVGSVFAASTYNCAILNWRWSPDYPTVSDLTSTQLSAIRAFDNRTDVRRRSRRWLRSPRVVPRRRAGCDSRFASPVIHRRRLGEMVLRVGARFCRLSRRPTEIVSFPPGVAGPPHYRVGALWRLHGYTFEIALLACPFMGMVSALGRLCVSGLTGRVGPDSIACRRSVSHGTVNDLALTLKWVL